MPASRMDLVMMSSRQPDYTITRGLILNLKDTLRTVWSLLNQETDRVIAFGVLNASLLSVLLWPFRRSRHWRMYVVDNGGSSIVFGGDGRSAIFRKLFRQYMGVIVFTTSQERIWKRCVPGLSVHRTRFAVAYRPPPPPPPGDSYVFCGGKTLRDFKTLEMALAGMNVPVIVAYGHDPSRRHGYEVVAGKNLVVYRGVTPNAFENLISGSSLVVVPLVETNLPVGTTVCVQAMAAGKPVVGTRNAGLIDYISDGETGFLIPPGDSAALRDKISYLIRSPEVASLMGRRARRIAEKFDIEWLGRDITEYVLRGA